MKKTSPSGIPWVFMFNEHKNIKSGDAKGILGGKGLGLAQMTSMGFPVPFGFTITTEACNAFGKLKRWPDGLKEQVDAALVALERKTGKKIGDKKNPLLVSVRSGARMSMPGMMDTVLNAFLNDEIVEVLGTISKNPRFAYDSCRRFICMFGDVVMGIKKEHFDKVFDAQKAARGVKADTDLNLEDLKQVVAKFKEVYRSNVGSEFPQDPRAQLTAAINAVFASWSNPRAVAYRNLNRIPHDLGTAVNVQEMVFGNLGNDSATGVAFTRNPSTGENKRYGEFLPNAQGEDVVAGLRTPLSLEEMRLTFPDCTKQLYAIFDRLEKEYKDMQDVEFTIERNKLFILQTRSAKRTAAAAVRAAVEMVKEGMIDAKTAVSRVEPAQLDTLLHDQIDPKSKKTATLITKGLPASPGAAVGQVVFTAEDAVAWKAKGLVTVLVREETSPEDITGMIAAEGILTSRGGQTSHAAVVARGMNKCCVAGAGALHVDTHKKHAVVDQSGLELKEGDWITLDGATGEAFVGKLAVVPAQVNGEFEQFLKICDSVATLKVRANADTPADAAVALSYGAKGVGLTRTEHMFFDPARLPIVRQMIIADDKPARVAALNKLLPFQRDDFRGILGAMSGFPVVIRLIDPPLHEFLPHETKDIEALAADLGLPVQKVQVKVNSLKEQNPMLGFRGCRLGVVYPEINDMQVQAIFEASLSLIAQGKDPRPCIEVPLVGELKEYMLIKNLVKEVAIRTGAESKVKYEIGTMIEVPRAALTANKLATEADFFSFGTNDLTQMSCGFSRDDSAVFLREYVAKGVYKKDPFVSIDQEGVGKLMEVCVSLGRATKPNIDIGICGEHGGDPESIAFCHRIGLDNVSCSPFRVPIARLAAAQAAVTYGPGHQAQHAPAGGAAGAAGKAQVRSKL